MNLGNVVAGTSFEIKVESIVASRIFLTIIGVCTEKSRRFSRKIQAYFQ